MDTTGQLMFWIFKEVVPQFQ